MTRPSTRENRDSRDSASLRNLRVCWGNRPLRHQQRARATEIGTPSIAMPTAQISVGASVEACSPHPGRRGITYLRTPSPSLLADLFSVPEKQRLQAAYAPPSSPREWIFLWRASWSLLANARSHASQTCVFSPLCVRICLERLDDSEKVEVQPGSGQLNGFAPVCVPVQRMSGGRRVHGKDDERVWIVSAEARAKAFSHPGCRHLKGRSFVCTRLCYRCISWRSHARISDSPGSESSPPRMTSDRRRRRKVGLLHPVSGSCGVDGRGQTGVGLEMTHDLLALYESLLVRSVPVAPLPLARVRRLAAPDVVRAKMLHQLCARGECERTARPPAEMMTRRGRDSGY